MNVKNIFFVLVFCNLVTFFLMGLDKYKAKKNRSRISEKTLLFMGLFVGAFGSFFGMIFFRHKTKKIYFKVIFIIGMLINIGFIYYLYFKILYK